MKGICTIRFLSKEFFPFVSFVSFVSSMVKNPFSVSNR